MNKKLYSFGLILFLLTACAVSKTSSYDKLVSSTHKNDIWVVAHRAITGENKYPENSLPSMKSCIDLNLDIIEIDVRETKDGHLVVMHDKTVDRTTNGKGNVSDFTLAQIRALKLMLNGVETDNKVPTLAEVFTLVKGKIIVDLDIKLDELSSYQKIADLIKKFNIEEQIIVFLYDKDDIAPVHQMFPHVNIMPRVRSFSDIDAVNKYDYINIIHIDENSYSTPLMKQLIGGGKRIWMNTLGEYDKLEKAGNNGFIDFFAVYPNVNVVQTDLGVQLKKYLKEKK